MTVVICPGIHAPELTQQFLQSLYPSETHQWLIFPAQNYPAYSSLDILTFLHKRIGNPAQAPILLIGFSAGVVGAMGAATAWQIQSGKVKGLIALDGWGVPLLGNFPIHRLSHDVFTHWSSALLGAGQDNFYAEPAVEHLELWRSPAQTLGWWLKAPGCRVRCCAAEFLTVLLQKYQEL